MCPCFITLIGELDELFDFWVWWEELGQGGQRRDVADGANDLEVGRHRLKHSCCILSSFHELWPVTTKCQVKHDVCGEKLEKQSHVHRSFGSFIESVHEFVRPFSHSVLVLYQGLCGEACVPDLASTSVKSTDDSIS